MSSTQPVQGTCIFCPNPSGSREHVWPDWLRRFLISQVAGLDQADRERLDREANITTTRVCDACNRNWMRKLEERSSPMLKVLMVQGRYEISQRDIFFLRRWAIKTAAVFEAFDGNLHTSDQLRKTLRNGSSPDDVAVILGAYKGNTMLMHSRSVYADPQQNGQTVTWVTLVAGSMVLFVFNEFTRHKSVNLRPEVQAHFVQLAKSDPSPISWPYGNPIHDDLLDVASRGPNPEMRLD